MKTITLAEAHKRYISIKLPSAYNSVAHNTLKDDENKLDTKIDLLLKIKSAEKASGIFELRELIKINKLMLDYYNTANSNLYYKENIPKQEREYIKAQFIIATSEADYLEERLKEKISKVRIEL